MPFTQLFLPVFCIWALITVIFLELTLNPPLQSLILLFGLFYGFQKFLYRWFRNTTLNQAQAYLPLCCPNLLAAELSNAGVIRNHLCLSCIINSKQCYQQKVIPPMLTPPWENCLNCQCRHHPSAHALADKILCGFLHFILYMERIVIFR